MHADRLMGASEVDRMLAEAQRQADEQARIRQILQTTLQQTLTDPQRITILKISLIGARREDGSTVLMIALPTGQRIDVPIPTQMVPAVANGLMSTVADAQADTGEAS